MVAIKDDNEIRDCREEFAVYWSPNGYSEYGEVVFDTPIGIPIRNEQSLVESLDPQGHKIAAPLMLSVDRDLEAGGLIWLGNIDNLPSTAIQTYQIIEVEITPDLKSRKYDRWVKLIKYKTVEPSTLVPDFPIAPERFTITLSPGACVVVGTSVDLRLPTSLGVGAFVVAGNDVGLFYSGGMTLQPGAFQVS